jgi:hypothetical protein
MEFYWVWSLLEFYEIDPRLILFWQFAYLLKGFLDEDESNEGGKVLLGKPAANVIKYFFSSSLLLKQNKLACFFLERFLRLDYPSGAHSSTSLKG